MLSVKYQTQMLVLSYHMQFQLGQPDPPVPTSVFIVASPMAHVLSVHPRAPTRKDVFQINLIFGNFTNL